MFSCRRGKGEFESIIQPIMDLGFQTHSAELEEMLKKVLLNKNFLICVPYAFNSIKGRTHHSCMFWYL